MNNTFKKNLLYVLTLFVAAFALAFSVNVMPVSAATPALSKTAMTLKVGDRVALSLNNSSGKVTWRSTNATVAKVSSKGSVLAKKKGTAVISATNGGKAYTCKVRVNRTFALSEDEIKIKKKYYVDAILSVNGAVNAVVEDPAICSVSFGEWDGDVMPLTVIPKKKGTTTVKFTNTANSEYYDLKVTVTAVPITITFDEFTTTDGSPYMVTGHNEAVFKVKTNKAASKGVLKIYDSANKVIRTYTIGKMKAKKVYTVQWDGKDSAGLSVSGDYKYALVADSNKKQGGIITVYSSSPYGDGDGSESKPFKVSNVGEIFNMRYFNGAHFELDKDIDFNYSSLASLYSSDEPFWGSFNGASYKILNFVGYDSLFGYVGEDGEIKNLVLEGGAINEAAAVLCIKNEGKIYDCSIKASIICSKGTNAAGIYCKVNAGEIRTSKAAGTIRINGNIESSKDSVVTGSICAQNEGYVVDCASSVNITQIATVADNVQISSSSYGIICSGGLVGINDSGAFTINCEYSGAIKSSEANNKVERFYVGYAVGYNKAHVGVCQYDGKDSTLNAIGGGMSEI
ncbi:MAG: Ig-like domain-containing protein [Lachnospiraceae bacterium]|nr:Ig-like domain-containing protein [Lachnospiraceae bacterium]